ncbi:uncharacterized protein MONBRDRAFT_36099 [Monosiga brevicollis MX1]|uniref:Uncharacterized protein n=1 Tax=Monosiga brevicollis TaxID=81824 RepID=A9UT29_MONBE|nr:uncharacterized protein MONBRDRAFT_36099 [Monosiga brevicollis MX1]EDQ91173.1 predicted protein [Monosiga brevicollis MX1]|eukprot:XP_001743595.1 hypothetical protein [Monosiga brevicollis MX1]
MTAGATGTGPQARSINGAERRVRFLQVGLSRVLQVDLYVQRHGAKRTTAWFDTDPGIWANLQKRLRSELMRQFEDGSFGIEGAPAFTLADEDRTRTGTARPDRLYHLDACRLRAVLRPTPKKDEKDGAESVGEPEPKVSKRDETAGRDSTLAPLRSATNSVVVIEDDGREAGRTEAEEAEEEEEEVGEAGEEKDVVVIDAVPSGGLPLQASTVSMDVAREVRDSGHAASASASDAKHRSSKTADGSATAVALTPAQVASIQKMSNLALEDVVAAVIMPTLKQIFRGEVQSWRHEDFRAKGARRSNLKFHVCFGALMERQRLHLEQLIIDVFCKRKLKYMEYAMNVLMPEAVEQLHAHVLSLDQQTAAQRLKAHQHTATDDHA